jgi:hypothetical protein
MSLLQEAERQRLTDALLAASRYKKVGLHFNKGLAGAPDEAIAAAKDMATNPVMTEAFALAIIAGSEGPRYPGLAHPALDAAAARKDARDRSCRRRTAPHCAGRGLLCLREQLLQCVMAGCILGIELSAFARGQSEIRSRRPLLRASQRRQRGLVR